MIVTPVGLLSPALCSLPKMFFFVLLRARCGESFLPPSDSPGICLICLKTIPVELSRLQGNTTMKNISLENPFSTFICLFPLLGGNKQFAFPATSRGSNVLALRPSRSTLSPLGDIIPEWGPPWVVSRTSSRYSSGAPSRYPTGSALYTCTALRLVQCRCRRHCEAHRTCRVYHPGVFPGHRTRMVSPWDAPSMRTIFVWGSF